MTTKEEQYTIMVPGLEEGRRKSTCYIRGQKTVWQSACDYVFVVICTCACTCKGMNIDHSL